MKKSLYIYLILMFFFGKSFGYNKTDLAKLEKGIADLKNTNLEKATIKKAPKNVDFSDANLKNCFFNEVNFQGTKFNNKTKLEGTVFLKCKGLDNKTIEKIRKQGGYVSDFSIICNSDIHYPKRKGKIYQLKTMEKIAQDKKNSVKAAIIAGDMVDRGEKEDWNKFKKYYYNKLEKNMPFKYRIFMCIGNHDRWRKSRNIIKEWFSKKILKERSYASKAIEKMYHGKYYEEYLTGSVQTHIVSLGECPSFDNYKSAKWYANKKWEDPSIVFFHYTPLDMVEWWTTEKKPLEMGAIEKKEKGRGKYRRTHKHSASSKETRYFGRLIEKKKDKTMLLVAGHLHSTYYRKWHGVPLICTGGANTFAVAYFDRKKEKCIAIKVINYKNSKKNKFYFPQSNR